MNKSHKDNLDKLIEEFLSTDEIDDLIEEVATELIEGLMDGNSEAAEGEQEVD